MGRNVRNSYGMIAIVGFALVGEQGALLQVGAITKFNGD